MVLLPGWFKDTPPQAPDLSCGSRATCTGQRDTLQALYRRVAPDGFIIVDDTLPGCRPAVDDFRERHKISARPHDVDGAAVYWRRA